MMKSIQFRTCVALLSLLSIVLGISSCSNAPEAVDTPPVYSYRVINAYPHDRNAFTQGLVIDDGILYEGTGLYGESTLRRVDLETGEVLQQYKLADNLFGEGITVYEDTIIQITWKSKTGFLYDKTTFDPQGEFSYPTEGWGITHDGENLIMSDGTSTLYFLDPDTLKTVRQVEVRDNNFAINMLNELEYINGQIYANIWQTDRIVIIDPEEGLVTGWVDLTGLFGVPDRENPNAVLNGIAYDTETDRLFVTGKLWPRLFEIELVQKDGN